MRIRKYYIGVALVLILSIHAYAQDSVRYSTLSLSLGMNSISNKDLFQSPYTYKGTNLQFNSTYTRFGMKGQYIVDLTYSSGKVESIVSPQANNKLILFNYDYLLRIKTKSHTFFPSAGVGVHTLLSNTNYLPEVENPKSYLSGGAYLTLSANAMYSLCKRSSIRMQVGIPLVGFVYRPDFEINGETLTKATVVGRSSLFSAKLEYDYTLTKSLSLTATYNYNYFTFDEPRSITILQNSLMVGLRKMF